MAESSMHGNAQKEEGILFDVARTVGATLGNVAGRISSQTKPKRARKSRATPRKKRSSRPADKSRKRARSSAWSKTRSKGRR